MNRNLAISGSLLAIGIAAWFHMGRYEPVPVMHRSEPEPSSSSSERVTPAVADTRDTLPPVTMITPVPQSFPASAEAAAVMAARMVADFTSLMDRFRRGDSTLTDEELHAAEFAAAQAIEHSPEARRLFSQKLAHAFRTQDTPSMFALERAFQMSDAGLTALVEIYEEAASRGDSLSGYAIQGLNQLQPHLTEAQRVRYLEMAVRHFNSHQNPGDYLPAMMFMTDAVAERQANLPVHSDIVLRMIQSRHALAQTDQEQFFTAQSLYRLLPEPQRLELANRTLSSQPTPGNIEAVLDALQRNSLRLDAPLRNALYASISQTRLSPHQLELANSVLGLTPITPQPQDG